MAYLNREVDVSTFYLLPARPLLGERLAGYLQTWLPGLEWPSRSWSDLAEVFASAFPPRADTFVVFGDELPLDNDVMQALRDGFGAEAGDEVIEVQPGLNPGEMATRRWQVGRLSKAVPPADGLGRPSHEAVSSPCP